VRARRYGVSVEKGAKLIEGPYVAETFRVTIEDDYVVVEA
jgi:3-phenylpropionate/trans-cinnamate dioxygenase ferredoxin subunit